MATPAIVDLSSGRLTSSRSKYQPSVDDIQFVVDALNKTRVLSRNPQWSLPEKDRLFSTPKFQVMHLQQLQQSLFTCKSQLNTFKTEDWRIHTKKRNLIGNLLYTIRSNDWTELCIQSWPKLWEILHKFEMVPQGITELNSVHLCEAPGSFVSALNHFLKQNRPEVTLNWIATSLNPYFEDFDPAQVINDDRVIRHTLDRWVFGPDNSGNLFNPELIDELKTRSRDNGEILLVTADGSQENVQSDELVVVDILFAEAMAALKILSKGGNFVMKIFTVFECPTLNFVYLLCSCFESVDLFKPISSREASSEMYLVCRGYRFGRDDAEFQEYLRFIEESLRDESKKDLSMFPQDCIAKDFQKNILDAMRFYAFLQEEVIDANIASFPFNIYVHEWNRRKFIRSEVEKRFLKSYPITNLPAADRICPFVEPVLEAFEIDNAFLGSWEEQNVLKLQMNNEELITQLRMEFQVIKYSFEWPYTNPEQVIEWTKEEDMEENPRGPLRNSDPVKVIRGGVIKDIRNSRFITKRLLNFFHEVVKMDFGLPPNEKVTVLQKGPRQVQVTFPLSHFVGNGLRQHENAFVAELLAYLKGIVPTAALDLVFANVLLIGQRSVGLLYLLSQGLRGTDTSIKLTDKGELWFCDLTPETASKLVQELEKWTPLMEDETVHSFVDIQQLRSNTPDAFFDLVKIFNVHCCLRILNAFFQLGE